MIKTQIFALSTFLLLTLFQANAQNEKDESSLILILNQVQTKFACKFSYVDQEVKGISLMKPPDTLTLNETISFLAQKTPFKYTYIDDKNIALSLINSTRDICGILYSLENKPLSNVEINTNTVSTISNDDGSFELEILDPNEIITIYHIGYKPLKLSLENFDPTPCKKIILIPEIQYLNEVVIRDYLTKGIGKNSDGSITIDYTDFGILPGLIEPDLLQTIQALPGILSINETVSNINVRGGTNDQNLILWDGVKMYQSSHFFGLISAFNPYLTKNVVLTKNGSSAQYGDGVSSVIAMNTDNTINTKLDAGLGLNMISADGYIDTPVGKKSSLQLAVRRSINDVVKTPTYDQYFDKAFQGSEAFTGTNTAFSFFDASFRWLYQLSPKDLIKSNVLVMGNDLVFQESNEVNMISISRESSIQQNNYTGGLLYQRNWSDVFRSEITFYGTKYRLEAINADIPNDQRLLQENEVLESGIKLNTLWKLSPNLNLHSGYQFNETGISDLRDLNNPTFRDFTKEVLRTSSIFSEIEYRSQDRNTHLNFGMRLNHFNKFDTYLIEPRLSLNHRFKNHITLEVLGEIKSQTTSQVIESQNDFLGIENRKWVLSNDTNIPIITSQQASLGLSYNHNNWLISTDFYYKQVDGIIAKSQGFQNDFEGRDDHGKYAVFGIDFLLNKQFKNFSTWFSYSNAKNDYTFAQLNQGRFPNNLDIRHNINLAVAYTLKNFKISGGLNWHSGKPTTRPISGNSIEGNRILYENPNSATLKDYIRLDTSATYDFKISKKMNGLLGISLWNILNQENTINNFYTIEGNTIIDEKESGLRFTPNAVIRINF